MFITDLSLYRMPRHAYTACLVRWMLRHGQVFGMFGALQHSLDSMFLRSSRRVHVRDGSISYHPCLMRPSFVSTKSCREFVGGLYLSQHGQETVGGIRHTAQIVLS